MRLRLILAGTALLLAASAAARADTFMIDAFKNPFPASPCILDAERHVIYSGLFCVGTCPPDSFRTNWCGSQQELDWTNPSGSADGGMNLGRYAAIHANSGGYSTVSSAELAPVDPRIEVNTNDPLGSALYLTYWSENGESIDLAARGAIALRIRCTGQVSTSQPLVCEAMMASYGAIGGSAYCTARANADGDFVLPINQFVAEPGFDLAFVWTIALAFEDCEGRVCSGTVPPRRYWIGPPQFDVGAATPALRRSWGQLKAAYR